MGNEEWGMGNGEWGMGNGKWGKENWEWRMKNGEWRRGNGESLKAGISKMVMFNEFPPKRATFPQTAHTFGRFHSTL